MEWLPLHSQLSCLRKCTMSKLLAILLLEHFPAIQHHRNGVITTYPALQIPAAVRPRPMKNHHPQKNRDGKKERFSAAKKMARPPANEWHNNLVPLNKLASLSTSQTSTLDGVNDVDNQIRDLTMGIDDIDLPFQGVGLAKKMSPGANFGNWVISRKNGA